MKTKNEIWKKLCNPENITSKQQTSNDYLMSLRQQSNITS